MSTQSKYKSIGVSVETYEKIVEIAKVERRTILQQTAMLVDKEYSRMGLDMTPVSLSRYSGLSSVIED